MSAIAGILFFDNVPVESGLIEKLTTAMKSRGPDEQTHWVQGSVALGHCMLRTTPESLEEHQPLMSQDKSLVLVWDGRLDNREELQRELKSAGIIPRDNSDAELVLQSYEAWGEECPQKLLGDFVFALWDARLGKLFCVRDHMGARPFYYTSNDRFFAFASEDESLLTLPGVSHNPNKERIAYFLVPEFQGFDYTHSWLEDVWALRPATAITVRKDRNLIKNTYWELLPAEETQYASDRECQEAFLEVFGEAVRCRMRAIGNVSAMMSGGLDSASIVAMAKRLKPESSNKRFHTYSAISDQLDKSIESQCIQCLIDGLGHEAHLLSVPSFSGMIGVRDLIDVAWTKPHPVDNSILLPALMCLAASRDGHRVLLHGGSGDITTDVPNNYMIYPLLARQWRLAWAECLGASHNNTYLYGASPYWLLLKSIGSVYLPNIFKKLVRRHRQNGKSRSTINQSLIRRDFAIEIGLPARMQPEENMSRRVQQTIQQIHRKAIFSLHGIATGLAGYERVAGRYGVELRDPWGDRRVVEFFFRLPLKYKVRKGWTKYLVRTSLESDLSPKVSWRLDKEHLGWNFVCRLMDETDELVSRTMSSGLFGIESYVDTDKLRKRYDEYQKTKDDASRNQVYEAMIIKLWLERVSC